MVGVTLIFFQKEILLSLFNTMSLSREVFLLSRLLSVLLLFFVCFLFVCLFTGFVFLEWVPQIQFACIALWLLHQSAATRHFVILMKSGNTLSYKTSADLMLLSKLRQIVIFCALCIARTITSVLPSHRFNLTFKRQNELYSVYMVKSTLLFLLFCSGCRNHPVLITIFRTPQQG